MLQWLSIINLYLLWKIYQQKKTNTITINVTTTALINYHSKKVRDCYILHAGLLVMIILLLIAVGICCYLIKYRARYLLPFHK